jgi:hypothetical protein
LIRIGIELTFDKLRRDIVSHPSKYFFILIIDNQAAICDSQGEDLRAHIVDGMVPDKDGNLVLVFEGGFRAAIIEQADPGLQIEEEEEFRINSDLEAEISKMPGLIDWIMFSFLNEDRHLLLNPCWVA